MTVANTNHASGLIGAIGEIHAVGVDLDELRESTLALANRAADLVDRVDAVREQLVTTGGDDMEGSWERFLNSYHEAYSTAARQVGPAQANQEALRVAFEELICPPTAGASDEQERQLLLLRANGWVVRVLGMRDGLMLVEGTEPHGDLFRGHIKPEGAFVSEPVDVARRGQIHAVAPVRTEAAS